MGSLSIWHWIVVIAVVLLLFGRGKISELMGDVAQGIKAFKKGMSEDEVAKAETPAADAKTINHQAEPPSRSSRSSPPRPRRRAQPDRSSAWRPRRYEGRRPQGSRPLLFASVEGVRA